jgi:hypothetical protein
MLTEQSIPDMKIPLCILHTTDHLVSNYTTWGLHTSSRWHHIQEVWKPQKHNGKSLKTLIPHFFNNEVIPVRLLSTSQYKMFIASNMLVIKVQNFVIPVLQTTLFLPMRLTTDMCNVLHFRSLHGMARIANMKNDWVNQLSNWLAQF